MGYYLAYETYDIKYHLPYKIIKTGLIFLLYNLKRIKDDLQSLHLYNIVHPINWLSPANIGQISTHPLLSSVLIGCCDSPCLQAASQTEEQSPLGGKF